MLCGAGWAELKTLHSFLQSLSITEKAYKKAGSDVKSLRYQTQAVHFRTLLFQVILPEDPNNAIQDGKGMNLILSIRNGVQ